MKRRCASALRRADGHRTRSRRRALSRRRTGRRSNRNRAARALPRQRLAGLAGMPARRRWRRASSRAAAAYASAHDAIAGRALARAPALRARPDQRANALPAQCVARRAQRLRDDFPQLDEAVARCARDRARRAGGRTRAGTPPASARPLARAGALRDIPFERIEAALGCRRRACHIKHRRRTRKRRKGADAAQALGPIGEIKPYDLSH